MSSRTPDGDSSTPRCQWCNRPRHDGRCPSYIAGVEAERDQLRDTLTEVGKWMSGGDFAGWENVLAEIERTLDADQ